MSEQKARALVAEADKKLNSTAGFFSKLFGSSSALEDAVDLYQQAANNYKIAKLWSEAGETFRKAAKVTSDRLQGSKHEIANLYIEAANCFKKNNKQEAVACLQEAVLMYEDMGRFGVAAKHYAALGELYEADEILNIEAAVMNFEKAAEYYEAEDSNSNANKYKLKVAHYSALAETTPGYEKAISIYEEVARRSIENNLLKWSAKDHYFRAVLCSMCLKEEAQPRIVRYEEEFPSFASTRECKLVRGIADALAEGNVDTFTSLVQEYDDISTLDKWHTSILLKIKKSMNEEPDLC